MCVMMFFVLQYRNMTTVLTREYLDARPDGWLDYAAKRIAQLYCVFFCFVSAVSCSVMFQYDDLIAFECWMYLFTSVSCL